MRFIRLSVIVLFSVVCRMVSAQDATYVDLGLSVKWSTVNTGITAERPAGDYYRWTDAVAIKTTDGSRMGTKAEWEELRKYCTWKWTEQNGIKGYLVTSKIKGFTNNSIFLPAAGKRYATSLFDDGSYAGYWTSSLYSGLTYYAESFFGLDEDWFELFYSTRENGMPVRPVLP